MSFLTSFTIDGVEFVDKKLVDFLIDKANDSDPDVNLSEKIAQIDDQIALLSEGGVNVVRAFSNPLNTVPYTSDWLKLKEGPVITPDSNSLYLIMDGSQRRMFYIWHEETQLYIPAATRTAYTEKILDNESEAEHLTVPNTGMSALPAGKRTRVFEHDLDDKISRIEVSFTYNKQYNSHVYIGFTGSISEIIGGNVSGTYNNTFVPTSEQVFEQEKFVLEMIWPGTSTNYYGLTITNIKIDIYRGRVVEEVQISTLNEQSIDAMTDEAVAALKAKLGIS